MKISIGLARHILSSQPGVLNGWWALMHIRSQPNCLSKFTEDRLNDAPFSTRRFRALIKIIVAQGWVRTDNRGNYFPVGADQLFGKYCGGNSCATFECPLFDTPTDLQKYLAGVLIQAIGNSLRYQASNARMEKREPATRLKGAESAKDHAHIAVSLKLISSFIGCTHKNAYQLRKKAVASGLVSFTRQYSNFAVLDATPAKLIGRAKESMSDEDARKIVKVNGHWCIECASLCKYMPLTYVKRKVKQQVAR